MDHERGRRRGQDGRRSRSRSAERGDEREPRDGPRRSTGGRRHSREDAPNTRRKSKGRRSGSHGADGAGRSASPSPSSASSAPSQSARRRHHSHKRRRKEKKTKDKKKKDKKHKTKKKSRRRSRSRSPSASPPAARAPAPPGAHDLAAALARLFDAYPGMSSLEEGGLPLLLIQLGKGTEYHLSHMPDGTLAGLLGAVFRALGLHGMERGSDGAWRWGAAAPAGGKSGGDERALLRLVRALLNGVGFTMGRVERYEHEQRRELTQVQRQHRQSTEESLEGQRAGQGKETIPNKIEKTEESEQVVRQRKRVERMTSQLLDRFDPQNSSSSASSLAHELQGICDVVLQGESVQLDGIENGKLKATLAQLFQLVGLQSVEMEEDDGEGGGVDGGHEEGNAMGYALPPDAQDPAASCLAEVLRTCRFRSSGGAEGAPTSWAANPAAAAARGHAREASSSDDDDGPAPLGTLAAVRAARRPRPPPAPATAAAGGAEEGGREEWMTVPGEHDFLKGIQAGGGSARGRTFKNERNRGQAVVAAAVAAAPLRPEVLAEVGAIREAYERSRGPSLLDAHRQQVRESKQRRQGGEEWNWSRADHLDEGRRVDKDALHTVLGGARTELKSKFQGSHGH